MCTAALDGTSVTLLPGESTAIAHWPGDCAVARAGPCVLVKR